MHSFVFSTFQSSSPMITSQTTCMVKRRGRYSFNTHDTILKSCWRGRRLGGQLSIATGLKLQGHSTSLKAQYLSSASAVSQMRFICLFTVYDATFRRFLCCMWNFMLLCNGIASYIPTWCNWVLKLSDVIRLWNPGCFYTDMKYLACFIRNISLISTWIINNRLITLLIGVFYCKRLLRQHRGRWTQTTRFLESRRVRSTNNHTRLPAVNCLR